MAPRGIEIDLPDLPEVSLRLGPAAMPFARAPVPWAARVRESLAAYLPLLLMAGLALASWWLVKQSPPPATPAPPAAARSLPDTEMQGFGVRRYAPDGRLMLVLEGQRMRHFPQVDRLEFEGITLQAWAPDGRPTQAVARQALVTHAAERIELRGGAQVRSRLGDGTPVEIDSEFLQLLPQAEQVFTDRPVQVRAGSNRMRAAGLRWDHPNRQFQLQGPLTMSLPPGRGPGTR